jgi:uncharacterized integral membrane protein
MRFLKLLVSNAIGLILAYILAAPLTSRISLNFNETAWGNAMTYVMWALAPCVWGAFLFCILIAYAYARNKMQAKRRAKQARERAEKLTRSVY